jgi:hypothetical protein
MKECTLARNLLPVQYVAVVSDSRISYKNICVYIPKNALTNAVMKVVIKHSVHQAVELIMNKVIPVSSSLNVFIVLDILRIG